jgi:ribosomal protein L11 methyltransferase
VRAVDVSIAAVAATAANAERNRVAHLIEVDATPVADLEATFDIVLANILAPTIVQLAGDLRRLVAPGGVLIVSGVLTNRHDHVVAALAPMQVTDRITKDGWTAVVLRH